MARSPNIQVVQQGRYTTRRRPRRPQHTFHLEHRAYQIQPFMIAPVLPGETMQNLLMQARVVTDPVKNPLIGWHLEYYFFYVKHRDLVDHAADMEDLMLNPAFDDANIDTAATTTYNYTFNGAIDWVQMCLNRVVDVYFRDDGEDHTTGTLDNLPLAHVEPPGWLRSFLLAADQTTEDVELLDISAATTFGGGDDKLHVSEFQRAWNQYQLLFNQGLISQTYEEYLATHNISVPQEELHEPELLRYVREWQYPSNTIDPTNGTPRSAVSWSVQERADKNRFFSEPGFVFGVTCARPKLYFGRQQGAAVGIMNSVYQWLPAVLSDNPETSRVLMPDLAGPRSPLGAHLTDAGGAWIDIKDLFLYGDQFVNFAVGADDGTRNVVALPTSSGTFRYLGDSSIDALFVSDVSQRVRHDGIVALTINSPIVDTTANRANTIGIGGSLP